MERFLGTAVTEGMGKLILFNTVCWTFRADKSEIEGILKSIDGHLIEGKSPQMPGEMLISKELSRFFNKGVGDQVGEGQMLRQSFVLGSILKELSILISLGLACGITLGQLTISLFYLLYCHEKGIPYEVFNLNIIYFSATLAIVIYLLSFFPIRRYIAKMDWVESLQQSNT